MKNFELKNFPFEHDGMTYWWSRSLTGVNVVFCYSKIDNEWCVLADKRGEGCPTCIGMWNVPCGYCDTNETVKQTAIRESLEESGVTIPKDKCKFFTLNTVPHGKFQNYNATFYTILDGDVTDYPTSNEYNEPNETSDIRWIPMSKLDEYKFAFNQAPIIKYLYDKFVAVCWFKKMLIRLSDWLDGYVGKKYLAL